jgi:hypothetical protein
MGRYTLRLSTAVVVALLVISMGTIIQGAGRTPPTDAIAAEPQLAPLATDLLSNGNMEELPFYWKPPNHFVAGDWLRWWIGDDIPEYDDVRPWRPERYDGQHAQIYFRWGLTYTAGIYQQVTGLEPCQFYQFDMYGRNHSYTYTDHHARIGLDPLGRVYNTIDEPGIESLPGDIVWSPEQTFYFEWGRHTVTAEAQGDVMTAIVSASPEPGHGYYDTFWDAGTLVQVDQPPGDRLPEPDSWTGSGFIQNLSAQSLLDQMVITWDTPAPASTQVWYTLNVTPTNHSYSLASPADLTPTVHHRVVVDGLRSGDVMYFVAASRRFTGAQCVTEVSAQQLAAAPLPTDRLPEPNSWVPSGFLQNVRATPILDSIFVSWQTPERASATQVWYNVLHPTTPTIPYSNTVYVPLIVRPGATYEFATVLDLVPVTSHGALIRNLQDGDTVHLVAVSSYVEDDEIITEVSEELVVSDIDVPSVILKTYVPLCLRE